MAALGSIRKRGALLIGVIGLALFGFIAGDVFRSCETQGNEGRMQIGEVAGTKLSQPEYQELINEIEASRNGQQLTDQERNQVWRMFVENTILQKECEKLGLTVTDEELKNLLTEGTHPALLNFRAFINQTTNKFDITLLKEFLSSYKQMEETGDPQAEQLRAFYYSWKGFEKNLRSNLLQQKYYNLLSGCALSNPVEAEFAFNAANKENKVILASFPYSAINGDSIEVSDADIKAKYEELKENFKTVEELRDIKYVSVRVLPSEKDREALMNKMNDAAKQLSEGVNPVKVLRDAKSEYKYNGIALPKNAYANDIVAAIDTLNVGETSSPFVTSGATTTMNVVKLLAKKELPDSVEIRGFVVGGVDMADAQKNADSIVAMLKSGVEFDSIKVENGQAMPKTWLTIKDIDPRQSLSADNKALFDACLNGNVKDLKVLPLSNYVMVYEILDRRSVSEKYDVAVVKTELTFSNDTYNSVYNTFSRFVSESQTIEDLEKNAPNYEGYMVLEQTRINCEPKDIAGVAGTRDVLKWIFTEEKTGAVSPLFENSNRNNLMVVALTDIVPAGYTPISKIEAQLKSLVVNDKKFEQAKEAFANVTDLSAINNEQVKIDTLNNITFNSNTSVPSIHAYNESSLSGAICGAEVNKLSPVVKGNSGAYVFKVLEQSTKAGQVLDVKAMEQQLRIANMEMVIYTTMADLRNATDIVDKRYQF